MTAKGHRGRRNLSRAFNRIERYKTDEVYRENVKEYRRNFYLKNKEKILEQGKRYRKELTIFANRKCKEKGCNKILNYRTKGDYCKIHFQKRAKKK